MLYGTDSFVIYVITEDFYEDIANDVEIWFDTSNCDKNKTGKRPLPTGKNKTVIGLFKAEIGGKIMTEFVGVRLKIYVYLIDGYDNDDYDKNNINK